MRRLDQLPLHVCWTRLTIGGRHGDHTSGAFEVPSPRTGSKLKVICSAALPGSADPMDQWDHVSVSLPNRCPNWQEMCFVKDLFFLPEETVMQLHVPPEDWISNHPFCLHLWRPAHAVIPRPPSLMVGDKNLGDLTKLTEAQRIKIAQMYKI